MVILNAHRQSWRAIKIFKFEDKKDNTTRKKRGNDN